VEERKITRKVARVKKGDLTSLKAPIHEEICALRQRKLKKNISGRLDSPNIASSSKVCTCRFKLVSIFPNPVCDGSHIIVQQTHRRSPSAGHSQRNFLTVLVSFFLHILPLHILPFCRAAHPIRGVDLSKMSWQCYATCK
jgi:hypothetical protein